MAIVTKNGKQDGKGDQQLKKLYAEAINGTESFSWLAPGHYDKEAIDEAYANGKLYRPLAKSFGLV
jgi:hypothetical protein